MTPIEARDLMLKAHAGQVDKSGQPYHTHPERVAEILHDAPVYVRVAAYLHDVLEDTVLTPRDLFDQGVGLDSACLIKHVTRVKGETYVQFIQRIAASGDRWAIRLKLADLQDNMSRPLPKEMEGLRRRYERATDVLTRTLVAMEETC